MKYAGKLPNKAYKSEIEIEVVENQLQAVETILKDGVRISSNGVEVDFPAPADAKAAMGKAVSERLSIKAIFQI